MFFGIHSLQSPVAHQFYRLLASQASTSLAPFNFMMASDMAATSATEPDPLTVDGMVWLLIHDDDHPEDKQFSFL